MLSNFSFTLGRSECGMRRGVYKRTGTASSLSGIWYSCQISQRPLKSLGYSALKSGTFSTLCTSGAGLSSRSACIAGFDRRLFACLDMTYTFSLCVLPVAWRVASVIWPLKRWDSFTFPGPWNSDLKKNEVKCIENWIVSWILHQFACFEALVSCSVVGCMFFR